MRVWAYCFWFDFWVGVFYDRKKHWLYLQPFPCVGLRFEFKQPDTAPAEGAER